MRGLLQANEAATVDAYMAWWTLAGVDCAIGEEPVDWLRPVQAAPAAANRSTNQAVEAVLPPPFQVMPQSLDAYRAWLAEDASQPERRWPGAVILPDGPAHAPLMVITDMPDPADMTAGILLADRAGQLFDAMLRAIDLSRAQVHITSLFLSRPPGGMVEAADLAAVAARLRTHVALAAPQRLLLLGDRTIRALSPSAENSLQFFNHDGGTVPAFATFHPRLLMGQPAAKAECWRVLQRLIEEMPQ